MEFNLISLSAVPGRALGIESWNINATIQMPAKLWAKYRDNNNLGGLYLDVSNHIYSINQNVPAHNPTVNHYKNASKGIKTINLSYWLRDPKRAEALGLKVTWLKSGEFMAAFTDYVDLLPKYDNVIQFKAVSK